MVPLWIFDCHSHRIAIPELTGRSPGFTSSDVSSGGPRNWRWWSHIARARGPRPGMVVGFPTEFPWGNFWKWNHVIIGDRIYETWYVKPNCTRVYIKGEAVQPATTLAGWTAPFCHWTWLAFSLWLDSWRWRWREREREKKDTNSIKVGVGLFSDRAIIAHKMGM